MGFTREGSQVQILCRPPTEKQSGTQKAGRHERPLSFQVGEWVLFGCYTRIRSHIRSWGPRVTVTAARVPSESQRLVDEAVASVNGEAFAHRLLASRRLEPRPAALQDRPW